MTDTTPAIDPDLIEMKRRFIALTEQQAAFAKTLPKAAAIASGDAELTSEQRAESGRIQRELTDLASRIRSHTAFAGLDQLARYKLDEAASKAARADA